MPLKIEYSCWMSKTITASILYNLVQCPKRVELDMFGDPEHLDEVNAFVEMLWRRGTLYEQEVMRSSGLVALELSHIEGAEKERLTLESMKCGEPLIYNGRISAEHLLGIPDLLRRVGQGYLEVSPLKRYHSLMRRLHYTKAFFAMFLWLALLTTAETALANQPKDVMIGTFTLDEIANWEDHSFKGRTSYQLIGQGTPLSLQATCKDTASALYRWISVDLTRTPILRWSWGIGGVHPSLDDTTKTGDDYAARVYVVYAPDSLMPWRTKAVDYVWANSQPKGNTWPNAFTDHAMMVALRSGQPTRQEKWVTEARNVREDFKNLFGFDITSIDGVAIMTDCDNSGLPSTGYYRDLRFTAE